MISLTSPSSSSSSQSSAFLSLVLSSIFNEIDQFSFSVLSNSSSPPSPLSTTQPVTSIKTLLGVEDDFITQFYCLYAEVLFTQGECEKSIYYELQMWFYISISLFLCLLTISNLAQRNTKKPLKSPAKHCLNYQAIFIVSCGIVE